MQHQPPQPSHRCRNLALLRLLLLGFGAGLCSWAALPAGAQSASELQHYQQRLEQLFERLDQNNDRRLERPEVEGVPYFGRHFERLDQRQRGYLTPDDLRPGDNEDRREQAWRMFRRADRNGDGLIKRGEASVFPWLLERFEEVDSNDDGVLSRDEIRHSRWRQHQR